MRCSKATSLLQAYLDNELTSTQESRLMHHLKGCALCRMQLDAFKQVGEKMSLWKNKEPRRDLVSPVIQKIRYEQETPSAWQHIIGIIVCNKRKILAVGANLIILILIIFNIPSLLKRPQVIVSDTLPITINKRVENRPQPVTLPLYDPVDIATTFNDAIDSYNLRPVEKDMILENLISDANDIINGNIRLPIESGQIKYRRMQVIYIRGSNQNSSIQRVIFTQQIRHDEAE